MTKRITPSRLTLHDLAADWQHLPDGYVFRVWRGRVWWESADYGRSNKVVVRRLGAREAYLDPELPVELRGPRP